MGERPPARDRARRRRWLPYGLVVGLVLALGGCGISASNSPVDEGNAVASADYAIDSETKPPQSESDAGSAAEQVRNFLAASAGGLASANDQVKRFLSARLRQTWRDPVPPDNPQLTVVRLVGVPGTGVVVGDRTPVTVQYQVVGTMTGGLGRLDDLDDPDVRQMTFWVVGDVATGGFRIDEIQDAPNGLLLSDDAIDDYYLIKPLYFWDSTASALVPDVRYVPRTVTEDQRYSMLVNGLVNGPSPWLSGAVQRLPAGTTATNVVTGTDGSLQVRLSAEAAGAGDPDTLRRLKFQLQWTLVGDRSTKRVQLLVDDKPVDVAAADADYLRYNLSFTADNHPYDLVDQKVVALENGLTPPVLGAPENAAVVAAAIGQSSAIAALVRLDSASRRYLQFLRSGVSGHIDAQLSHTTTLGRPSFVPGTDVVLVPTGGPTGHLVAVSLLDGSSRNALSSVDGVTAAAVSPDGRRVAFVAGGEVYVSSLVIANNSVTVGSTPRAILRGQVGVTSVTWTSELELKVAGPTTIWRVTADGVVADNDSDKLGVLRVADVVCNPRTYGQVGVYVITTALGVYSFRTQFSPQTALHAPFFGT